MIEIKQTNNHPGIRTAIAVMIVCLCTLVQSGCAVGYITFHSDAVEREQTTLKLPDVKIAYCHANPERNSREDSTISSGFETALRNRFHILDIERVASARDRIADRFFIDIEKISDDSTFNYILAAINVASFAVIPVVVNDHENIIFTVRSPSGAVNSFHYSYTERAYSWLPFMLFAPGFMAGPQIGHDHYQETRLKMFEDITTRFMIEATPFILDQSIGRVERSEAK